MAKIKVVAVKTDDYGNDGFKLTPLSKPRRAQFICKIGIFNLMGINKEGTYTIDCKRVGAAPKKASRRISDAQVERAEGAASW